MMTMTRFPVIKFLAPAALVLLAACSVPSEPTDIHDPYESVNRVSHAFNKGLDTVAVRPASQVYGTVLPAPVRTSVDNVASNLGTPSQALNKALQGDVESAIHNTFRFLLNTTVGVLGLFDVADDFGLEERNTDFGQTLATWGAEEGAYLELPVFGPSTERDAAGRVVDAITNPLGFMTDSDDVEDAQLGGTVGSTLNYRYTFASTFDGILYDSTDSYSQLRLFYLENSRFNQGGSDADTIDTEIYDDLYGDLYDE